MTASWSTLPGLGEEPFKHTLLVEPHLSEQLARDAHATLHPSSRAGEPQLSSVNFQPCLDPAARSQDRCVVERWALNGEDAGRWTFCAVFDGHGGHETVDHACAALPARVKAALAALPEWPPPPEAVCAALRDTLAAFDDGLEGALRELFPKEVMNDPEAVERVLFASEENERAVLRCLRGTTAVLALVDPARANLWVANLGDSEAVLGSPDADGTWSAKTLTARHNGSNPHELQRLRDEHPGEDEVHKDERVLGSIAVTRALGDHLFKLPQAYATRVFARAAAAAGSGFTQSDPAAFLHRNRTPPYLSSTAHTAHTSLDPGVVLLLFSDGLAELSAGREDGLSRWVRLAAEEVAEGGTNAALAVLRDALGGEDEKRVSAYLTLECEEKWMDDTTVVVMAL